MVVRPRILLLIGSFTLSISPDNEIIFVTIIFFFHEQEADSRRKAINPVLFNFGDEQDIYFSFRHIENYNFYGTKFTLILSESLKSLRKPHNKYLLFIDY